MIDYREVRIGNIIGSKTFDQWEVRLGDIEQIFDSKDPDHYFGIELTPKWLIKLGFKKYHGWTGNEFYALNIGHIEFQWDKTGFGISTGDENTRLDHIKTIHQIQNLVHILTGTELEIKL